MKDKRFRKSKVRGGSGGATSRKAPSVSPVWNVTIGPWEWETGQVINEALSDYISNDPGNQYTTYELDASSPDDPATIGLSINVWGLITGTIGDLQGGTYNYIFKGTNPEGTTISTLTVSIISLEIVAPTVSAISNLSNTERGTLVTVDVSSYVTDTGVPTGTQALLYLIDSTSENLTGESLGAFSGIYSVTIDDAQGVDTYTVVINVRNYTGKETQVSFDIPVIANVTAAPTLTDFWTGDYACGVSVPTWTNDLPTHTFNTGTTQSSIDLNDYLTDNGGAITSYAYSTGSDSNGISLNTSTGILTVGPLTGATSWTGTFTATNSQGASAASSTLSITIQAVPAPTITSISGVDGSNLLRVYLDEACTSATPDYETGLTITVNSSAVTPTYVSGGGTSTLIYSLNVTLSNYNTISLAFDNTSSDITGDTSAQKLASTSTNIDYVVPVTPEAGLAAFPGAEGMGAVSIGGRSTSATVYIVTNLNDSGAGSFRAACEASGPRFVVFNVAGYINLDSRIDVNNPYMTIAGQTSPGGICVTGWPFNVLTHDVTVRYMRFRRGHHKGTVDDFGSHGESVFCSGGYNIIFDHCSITWGTDETAQIGSWNGGIWGVTFSWCIIGEGFNNTIPIRPDDTNHGYAFNFSDKFFSWRTGNHKKEPEGTIHHCYFPHSYNREPQLKGRVLADFRNNIVYNWFHRNAPSVLKSVEGDYDGISPADNVPRANIVSNYMKRGLDGNEIGSYGWFVTNQSGTALTKQHDHFYVLNNIGEDTGTGAVGEWGIAVHGQYNLADTAMRRDTEWDLATEAIEQGIPVTTTTMDLAYANTILETVGASNYRDSADTTTVNNFINGDGNIIENLSYPGDFPTLTQGTPPTDTNGDGIPDYFEVANGYSVGTMNPVALGTGEYLWIEEYINSLV